MGSSPGIGVSSDGYPRRAFGCIRNCLRNVISEQNTGGLEALGAARLAGAPGRCCSAMDSALVCWPPGPRWLATPRRDIMRSGEREVTVARHRPDRGRTEGARMIERRPIARSAITRRWPFGPGARRCCRRCVPGWVAPSSPHAARHFSRKLPPRANWNARLERRATKETFSPVKRVSARSRG